ncbi:MAG: replication initiation protein [Candidatus Thiodiazotropha sp. (ex Lucinoma aequizonata)]|nr:replication initiation protein [Candidatus Thiodiazotropha sp. (ex Lucinoma aequizonata)]
MAQRERLAKTSIEWEYTLGDDRIRGVGSLFSAEVHKSARAGGRLKFSFPNLLIPIIKEPSRFARLRVHFLLKLSGKYAVTLYEILEGFVNRRDGQCRVTIKELRTWLKVPPDSYPDWKDFKKRVLEPATKQINDDSLGAGFSVAYEPIRKGRFYNEIVFSLTKTPKRIAIDNGVKYQTKLGRGLKEAKQKGRPYLKPTMIQDAAHETKYFRNYSAHSAMADQIRPHASS